MQLSVIIPTRDRVELLAQVLAALREQTFRGEFETVVVNDGGNSAAKEVARKFGARFLEQPSSGAAAARNRGMDNARGKWLLFLGDDTIPTATTVEEHLSVHRERPGIAVVGQIDWHPSLLPSAFLEFLLRGGGQFSFHKIADREDAGYRFFYASNLSLEKRWLEEERFDTAFPDAAFEDIELGYRLCRKGLRVVFRPEARVLHYHPYDLPSYLERMRRVGRSAVRFLARCPEPSARWTYAPFSMFPGGWTVGGLYAHVLSEAGPTEKLRWKGRILKAYLSGYREGLLSS